MSTDQLAPVTVPAEQRELMERMNRTGAEVPAGTLDEHVLRIAAADPGRTAVLSDRRALTYGELSDEVRRLADRLLAAGAGPGTRVALCTEPDWEQLAGALAIMRTGAAYVPVPVTGPQTVRWTALTRAGASLAVTQPWLVDRLAWPEAVTVVAPDSDGGPVAAGAGAGDPTAAAIHLPAGGASAGGASADGALSHHAIVNAVADVGRRLDLGPDDRVLALAPVTSARSIHEMFAAALAGATLVFGADLDRHAPSAWLEQMRRHGVTVWMPTPTMLDLLLDHLTGPGDGTGQDHAAGDSATLADTLRAVVLSGERLNPDRVRELRAAAPQLTVGYATAAGPGLWVAYCDPGEVPDDWRTVPIGRPMANQRLFVLSEAGVPCPAWVTGRVYVGGLAAVPADGAAAGATHPETGEPLLPTDLVGRLRPEGLVEVVSDDASRLIVHGRPLNLCDAETALEAHPAVRRAAVVPAGGPGESAAAVQFRPGLGASVQELTDHLRRKVSPYLLPGRIEVTGALPLTEDGRVDRLELGRRQAAPTPAVVPQPTSDEGELTRRVTAVACRLFDVSDIEPNANLLEIGATSYQLVRLATVLEEELGIAVEVEELLRFPSIAVIVSGHVGATGGAASPATASPATASPAAASPAAASTVAPPAAAPAEPVVTGIVARQSFKDTRHGIRADLDGAPGVDLTAPADELIGLRRTTRTFDPAPVRLADLATLLAAVRMGSAGGEAKFRYPSAGGAYPVQVYLLVAPGRVQGLSAGSYYYHPARNRLAVIDPDGTLAASSHLELNRDAFRTCAFSLYLVGRMPAITPLYGDLSWDFTVFEAGTMAQLLAEVAVGCGLGLCPVGTMDTAPLTDLFRLSDGDRFVHALIGGVPGPGPS
jgi:nonribosomal peptide synthetase protein BlmIII